MCALDVHVPVHRLDDLIAWQLANAFKREVYALIDARVPPREFEFSNHLRKTVLSVELNVAEGFHRNSARDFARFLAIARASLGEAEIHLKDGIDRKFYSETDCQKVLELARRTVTAMMRLRRTVLDRCAPT